MTATTDQKQFTDPVCGMLVDPATAAAQTCYNGIQIYFCAEGCKKACDDLKDICGSCNSDYRDSCDYDHDVCDILKGKAGNDCCDAVLDEWEDLCK